MFLRYSWYLQEYEQCNKHNKHNNNSIWFSMFGRCSWYLQHLKDDDKDNNIFVFQCSGGIPGTFNTWRTVRETIISLDVQCSDDIPGTSNTSSVRHPHKGSPLKQNVPPCCTYCLSRVGHTRGQFMLRACYAEAGQRYGCIPSGGGGKNTLFGVSWRYLIRHLQHLQDDEDNDIVAFSMFLGYS